MDIQSSKNEIVEAAKNLLQDHKCSNCFYTKCRKKLHKYSTCVFWKLDPVSINEIEYLKEQLANVLRIPKEYLKGKNGV